MFTRETYFFIQTSKSPSLENRLFTIIKRNERNDGNNKA